MLTRLISDVRNAGQAAREEAQRELSITIVISLAAFLVGPLIFLLIVVPPEASLSALFNSFIGSDIYISAVSLLSIAVYSISRSYNVDDRRSFSFPHAGTILTISVLVVIVAAAAHTARLFAGILPDVFTWRGWLAGVLGIAMFFVTSAVAYAVLVLRNDMEIGAPRIMHDDQEEFVDEWNS